MHGFTDIIITSERKRQVTDTSTHMSSWQVLFNPSCGLNEVNGIIIVFLDTCSNSQYIRVEDDIVRIKAHLFSQDAISTSAHFNLTFVSICLTFLIESHDYSSSTQLLYHSGTFYKNPLSFLQRNGIDDRLSLQTFQACLYDFPLGRVYHNRNTGNLRFGHDEIQESLHFFLGIQQAVIHIHIDDQGSIFYLFTGNTQCFFVVLFVNQAEEFTGTSHIASLTYIDKTDFGRLFQTFQTRQTECCRFSNRNMRFCTSYQWNILSDVGFRCTTTTTDDVYQSFFDVFFYLTGHILGSLIVFTQTIRKTSIRIRTYIIRCTSSQLLQERLQLLGTE